MKVFVSYAYQQTLSRGFGSCLVDVPCVKLDQTALSIIVELLKKTVSGDVVILFFKEMDE